MKHTNCIIVKRTAKNLIVYHIHEPDFRKRYSVNLQPCLADQIAEISKDYLLHYNEHRRKVKPYSDATVTAVGYCIFIGSNQWAIPVEYQPMSIGECSES